jgi:hypothetical protein
VRLPPLLNTPPVELGAGVDDDEDDAEDEEELVGRVVGRGDEIAMGKRVGTHGQGV